MIRHVGNNNNVLCLNNTRWRF